MARVRTGLENLLTHGHPWIEGARLGLLCNPASVTGGLRHAREAVSERFPGRLRALFSPQHGFFAEKQDNMIESPHTSDPLTGLPVYSLYGETRWPTPAMYDDIDVLLVDLQDVGTRVYTFVYTMAYCMEAARDTNRRVLVLDRPNPVDGIHREGNVLEPEWASFVGRYPLPMRHGLTVAELARLFNRHFAIGSDLDVVAMSGWRRDMEFRDTGLPWVAPSPNLPTPESARVYPGQVLWEGTNLSEGRGTTQPFELFGAPYLGTDAVLEAVGGREQPGVVLRPCTFEPTSGKHAGTPCRGFQLHVTDPDRYRPYRTSLALLQAVLESHPEDFAWKPPPYEYEFEKLPIDLILGSRQVRMRLEAMDSVEALARSWDAPLAEYAAASRGALLY